MTMTKDFLEAILLLSGVKPTGGIYEIANQYWPDNDHYAQLRRKTRARQLCYNRALWYALKKVPELGYMHNYYRTSECEYGESDVLYYSNKSIENAEFATPIERVGKIKILQIKEKFGDLRVYRNRTDQYVDGILAMAEKMCSTTCETCGKRNATKYVHVTCEDHK
jgi:hypothetical protein